MINVLIDRHALGAVAEELGLPIAVERDSQAEYRTGYREIAVEILAPGGRGRVRLYSYIPVNSGTVPAIVPAEEATK